MDPLSITAGVVALLTACVKVGASLQAFHEGTAVVDAKVKGLLFDVESFTQVLQTIKQTLDEDKVQASLQGTGHIGNHFRNLSASIQDGHNTLLRLQSILDKVNKSVSVLDGPRKHLRLKGATEEILVFQLQIRSCRDTLQLSLQAVTLWNQVTFQESNSQILPTLDGLYQAIRHLATNINSRMTDLQTVVESNSRNDDIQAFANLRKCVQSAATVVSSASTALGVDETDKFGHGSDFGDLFPPEPNEAMMRWISSNTVYEFDGDQGSETTLQDQKSTSGKGVVSADEVNDSDNSDSDVELEVEIIQEIFKRGKKAFDEDDFQRAERTLRGCLTRITNGPLSTSSRCPKIEITSLLIKSYQQQEKWSEAHSLLMEKIALGARGSTKNKPDVLLDMLILVEVLLQQGSYAEALLYGRKALKGFRRLGTSGGGGVQKALQLLIRVCHEDGNIDEEEAFEAILVKSISDSTPPEKGIHLSSTLPPQGAKHVGAIVGPENGSETVPTPPNEPNGHQRKQSYFNEPEAMTNLESSSVLPVYEQSSVSSQPLRKTPSPLSYSYSDMISNFKQQHPRSGIVAARPQPSNTREQLSPQDPYREVLSNSGEESDVVSEGKGSEVDPRLDDSSTTIRSVSFERNVFASRPSQKTLALDEPQSTSSGSNPPRKDTSKLHSNAVGKLGTGDTSQPKAKISVDEEGWRGESLMDHKVDNTKCVICQRTKKLMRGFRIMTSFPCGHLRHSDCLLDSGIQDCPLCPSTPKVSIEEDKVEQGNQETATVSVGCALCGKPVGYHTTMPCGRNHHIDCQTADRKTCEICDTSRDRQGNSRGNSSDVDPGVWKNDEPQVKLDSSPNSQPDAFKQAQSSKKLVKFRNYQTYAGGKQTLFRLEPSPSSDSEIVEKPQVADKVDPSPDSRSYFEGKQTLIRLEPSPSYYPETSEKPQIADKVDPSPDSRSYFGGKQTLIRLEPSPSSYSETSEKAKAIENADPSPIDYLPRLQDIFKDPWQPPSIPKAITSTTITSTIQEMPRRQVLIIGDVAIGKTALQLALRPSFNLMEYSISKKYESTINTARYREIIIGSKQYPLTLVEAGAKHPIVHTTPGEIPGIDVILLCYSNQNQVMAARTIPKTWLKVVKQFKGVPYILVGLQSEGLFPHKGEYRIQSLARDIKPSSRPHSYLECSAKTGQGIHEVFAKAAVVAAKSKAAVVAAKSKAAVVATQPSAEKPNGFAKGFMVGFRSGYKGQPVED